LPPYSPDLNPVERVWKLLRRLRLHNQYFPTLGAVLSTVDEQFALWSHPNDALRKLCAIT
jgi:transposase